MCKHHHRHRCDDRCMDPMPMRAGMGMGMGMGCPGMMPTMPTAGQNFNMAGICTMTPRGPVCQIMPRDMMSRDDRMC